MLENMRIQTIQIVVFAKKDAHQYKNTILQIKVSRVVSLAPSVFLRLQMKQHDLVFPTRENGKTNELFFFSFVLDCIEVVMLPLSCCNI